MKKLSKKEKAIHDQFSKYGANAKEWMKKCVLMLPLIESERIWEKKGFGSIYEYAAKIAGMSRHKVKDSLRILRRIADKPALMEVAELKGLNAVRPVATIASRENDVFWAGKAAEMGKNTLVAFVKDFKSERGFGTGTGSPMDNGLNEAKLFLKSGGEMGGVVGGVVNENFVNNVEKNPSNGEFKFGTGTEFVAENDFNKPSLSEISMKLDPEVVEELKKIKGGGDWNELMKKLLRLSREGLENERIGQLLEAELKLNDEIKFQKELEAEKPAPVRSNSHKVPVVIAKYIKKRSGGVCEHPNCQKAGEHIHHTEPFAITKIHDPDKLLHLCLAHHRIIHLGYIDDGGILGGVGVESEMEVETEMQKQIGMERQWESEMEIDGEMEIEMERERKADMALELEELCRKQWGRFGVDECVEALDNVAKLGDVGQRDLVKTETSSWQQIEALPSYDIKNLINGRVAEFRR